MLRGGSVTLPPSLLALLVAFQPCFTQPTFRTFCALAGGFLAQTRRRTVCGMLTGAGLARRWSHHRVHRFFSRARWSLDEVSAVLAGLVVDLLIPAGEPVLVAVDDTLFRRSGRTVYAASWFHDGSATGRDKVGYGNNWVIAAVVVRLPFLDRPVALPVGFALVRKGTDAASRLALGRQLVGRIAAAAQGRTVHVVADSAYAGQVLRSLPAAITWTTRLRANAALSELAPPRTGKRGRPRLKGEQLPDLKTLAATTGFTPTTVHRYGATVQVHAAGIVCLWYRRLRSPTGAGRTGPRPGQHRLRRGTGKHRPGRHLGQADCDLGRHVFIIPLCIPKRDACVCRAACGGRDRHWGASIGGSNSRRCDCFALACDLVSRLAWILA